MKKWMFLFAGLSLLLFGCSKDENNTDNQAEIDRMIIEQYLLDNNIAATAHPSGLYYVINEPGVGGHPASNSKVIVKYKGYLTNGTVFDQTAEGKTQPFQLQNLIEGWQIGIPLLKKGGKGTFFIPSDLGYGSRSTSTIPANSVLIFEIELIDYL